MAFLQEYKVVAARVWLRGCPFRLLTGCSAPGGPSRVACGASALTRALGAASR